MITELAEQAQFYSSALGWAVLTTVAVMGGTWIARRWPRSWRP